MPGRILDRHVGGNTTYARELALGLTTRGVDVESMAFYGNAVATMVSETAQGMRQRTDSVLHYVADTGPLVRTRTPSVVTVHGVASRWLDGVRSPTQERVWRTRVRRAIDSTDTVVTVSNSSATDIASVFGCDIDDINVIPHGIDWEKFNRSEQMSPNIRERVPGDFLLYVGNIEPRKNILALVEAITSPDVRALGLPLVVAGKPAWNFQTALSAIEGSPDVIHLGFVSDSDRTALMQRATLFVFPSRYEGFGFPVLEAMAAGAPVLTTRAGALRDISGPSMALNSTEPESIAEGIVQAVTDEHWRTRVVQLGRRWASSFTWDASVEAHLGIYKKVLDR
ncbi:glycosyl transferase family 1 [Rhodococcus sp. EPR-157]|uniref:glycosyltransferase family 4 protein n=1 Tax=Rhodococcus sp. EPR-157 TaxID=1813677 RepID=UPI0007BB9923|nr:glycosyl transferase family 1 [Rhodococcus sp. EPR-157]